jgi:Abnormal spindle-like microcephaly-assoc'd, ASPM-SPD-2-Hydin
MALNGTAWTPLGPSPISEGSDDNGLVSSIAPHPTNPNTLYIGTVGGGVWRSADGGATWSPLFDRQVAMGVGEPAAIAIDPINPSVVYVGTSGRFNAQPQAGLFKSTDEGASWVILGSGYPSGNTGNAIQFAGQFINVIIVDPANSNRVYLASTSGVFASNDGGLNWVQGSNVFGDARSLQLDASTPVGARILYAGISGRGVFQSTDGGANWAQILSGTTAVVAAAVGGPPNGFGKVIVSLAPPTKPVANPGGVQVVYVSLQGTGGAPDPIGVFMSTDQGNTWVQQTATGMPTNTQGGYSFHFAVDPGSPGDGINDILYFGAVGQAKSTNSGNSFAGMGGLHADTHSWAFIPQPSPTPSVVFSGNDGGLAKSTDGGATWTHLSSGGLQTGLFYNIDVKPDAAGSVTVGALQDNEIETTKGSVGLGWKATQGGDGWDVAYDATVPGQVYGSSGFWFPNPCTRVHRSTDDGLTFGTEITPWGTTTDAGCYLAGVTTDPTTGNILYVSGSQNLWQSRDGGGTWRILSPFNGAGNVDVAAVNGNNVVIAVGSQVFVSTNALAATVGPPSGVVFTNITRNLPGRNVARTLFDPSDPTTIYAVMGGFGNGHVFRTTIGATAWTDISPALNVPFNALALDGSTTPTTIFVGTDFGVLRSVDGGLTWYVLDDIHFPRVPVLDLIFHNGILRAATYGRGVFGFVKPAGPSIAVHLDDDLAFGAVCKAPQFLKLEVFNVGSQDLVINSVQRLMGSTGFFVLPTPATPLVIEPGEEIVFTVRYIPTAPGVFETATIRISSNDPTAPFVDLAATGFLGTAHLGTAIADSGSFGDVCIGSFRELELTINNSGLCQLVVFGISSSSGEFIAPLLSSGLLIGTGESAEVTLRFQPTSFGFKTGTFTVISNDPSGPHTVSVSGVAPPPRMVLMIANQGSFGNVCVHHFKDEPLTIANSGKCALTVTGITSSSGDFLVPEVLTYPLIIEPKDAIAVPIRFQPLGFGAKTTTITVFSDDPAGPHTIVLTGDAPSGRIALTGYAYFGGVKCGHRAFRTISVCNVGECELHVSKVAFEHENRHWHLVHNPFPATLHPGSCLDVVIRYKATQREPHPCEVVIHSNDPSKPIVEVHAIAWTRCCCKECCEECHEEHECGERHRECCEDHRRECCDDRDDDRCEEHREEKHEEHAEERGEHKREERHEKRHHEHHHRHRHHHDEDDEDDE